MKFAFLSCLLLITAAIAEESLLERQLKCVQGLVRSSKLALNPRLAKSHNLINGKCTKSEGGKQMLDTACADSAWKDEPKRANLLATFYNGHIGTMQNCIRPKYQWTCLTVAAQVVRTASNSQPTVAGTILEFADETIKNCLRGANEIGSCATKLIKKEIGHYEQVSKIAALVGGSITEKCTDPPRPIVAAEGSLLDKQQKCVSGLIADTKIASNPRLLKSTNVINQQCIKSEGNSQWLDTACVDTAWKDEPKRSEQLANFYNGHINSMQSCIRPSYQWSCLEFATVAVRESAIDHPEEEVISEFAYESINKCLHGSNTIGSCAKAFYQTETKSYQDISKVAAEIGGKLNEKCSQNKFEPKPIKEEPVPASAPGDQPPPAGAGEPAPPPASAPGDLPPPAVAGEPAPPPAPAPGDLPPPAGAGEPAPPPAPAPGDQPPPAGAGEPAPPPAPAPGNLPPPSGNGEPAPPPAPAPGDLPPPAGAGEPAPPPAPAPGDQPPPSGNGKPAPPQAPAPGDQPPPAGNGEPAPPPAPAPGDQPPPSGNGEPAPPPAPAPGDQPPPAGNREPAPPPAPAPGDQPPPAGNGEPAPPPAPAPGDQPPPAGNGEPAPPPAPAPGDQPPPAGNGEPAPPPAPAPGDQPPPSGNGEPVSPLSPAPGDQTPPAGNGKPAPPPAPAPGDQPPPAGNGEPAPQPAPAPGDQPPPAGNGEPATAPAPAAEDQPDSTETDVQEPVPQGQPASTANGEQCLRSEVAKARTGISSNIAHVVARVFASCVQKGPSIDIGCHNKGWESEKKRAENLIILLEGSKTLLQPCEKHDNEKECVRGELVKLRANYKAEQKDPIMLRVLNRGIDKMQRKCVNDASTGHHKCTGVVLRQKVTNMKNIITVADRLIGKLDKCQKAA